MDAYDAGIEWRKYCEEDKQRWRKQMSAALGVVLDRMCGPFTQEECKPYYFGLAATQLFSSVLANRRASLLKPKEPTMESEIALVLSNYAGDEALARIVNIVNRRSEGGTHAAE